MQHGIAPRHGVEHAVRVADVAGDDFELSSHVGVRVVEPAPRVERVVQDERTDVISRANERLSQVRSYEPVGAGYQYAFHSNLVELFPGLDNGSRGIQ